MKMQPKREQAKEDKILKIHVANVLLQKQILDSEKLPYAMLFTGSQRKLFCNEGGQEVCYYDTKSEFNNKELNFIKKVRNEIIARCEVYERANGPIEELKSAYIDCSQNMPKSVNNCVEIDLSNAYWNFAWQMGYISDATYQEGILIVNGKLKYRKKVRLAALGSIARFDRWIKFDGLNYDISSERNYYSKIFFNISRYIFDVMYCCKTVLGDDYLFFWVDAVFFKNSPENIKLVNSIICDAGLESKMYQISSFKFIKTDSKIKVCSPNHKEHERIFNLNKNIDW